MPIGTMSLRAPDRPGREIRKGDKMTPKRQELQDKLDGLINDLVRDPEKLDEFSRAWSGGFYRYSLRNYMLARVQRPEGISILAGFNKWKNEHNRTVRKGEKALYIYAPRIAKDKEDPENEDKQHIYFIYVPVFDISQTDGEPVEVAARSYVVGDAQDFDALAACSPVPVHIKPVSMTAGQTNGKEIVVATEDKSHPQAVATLFHEWAHVLLHFGDEQLSGSQKELEAEAVSFIVSAACGIDNTGSAYYIGGWTKDADVEVRGSKIITTAQKILKAIEKPDAKASEKAA